MDFLIADFGSISNSDKATLHKSGYKLAAEVLLQSTDAVARKTRLPATEVERIALEISTELLDPPKTVNEKRGIGSDKFTTGDDGLDELLGGGLRVGALWEIAGEGASGKTQLALQLALTAQLPQSLGGLDASVCFITTHSVLSAQRLDELSRHHPRLSQGQCDLADIHTCRVDIPKALTYYLREGIVTLMESLKVEGRRPIKLIIIDSIASLFRGGKTMTVNLVERSKYLSEISALLHGLAIKHGLAAVVVNEVSSVFETEGTNTVVDPSELIYKDQSRWFNRPDDTFWDDKQDAALGLVWANQVNVRLFLSRTGRKTFIPVDEVSGSGEGEGRAAKRQRLDGSKSLSTQEVLLRRIDVVFSSFGPAQSIDFALCSKGFQTIPYQPVGTKSGYFGGKVDLSEALPSDALLADPAVGEESIYESGLALDAAASQLDEDEDWEANAALLDPD